MNQKKAWLEKAMKVFFTIVGSAVLLSIFWYASKKAFIVDPAQYAKKETNADYFKTFIKDRGPEQTAKTIVNQSRGDIKNDGEEAFWTKQEVDLAACMEERINAWLTSNNAMALEKSSLESKEKIISPIITDCIQRLDQTNNR